MKNFIFAFLSIVLWSAGGSWAVTYKAEFISDGPLIGPDEHSYPPAKYEVFFRTNQPISNLLFSGDDRNGEIKVSGQPGVSFMDFRIRTNSLGAIQNIRLSSYRDESGEYVDVRLFGIDYGDPGQFGVFSSTGSWTLRVVPIPASGILLALACGFLVLFRRRRVGGEFQSTN